MAPKKTMAQQPKKEEKPPSDMVEKEAVTDTDKALLIKEGEKTPALWDVTSDKYTKTRGVEKNLLWEKVAANLSTPIRIISGELALAGFPRHHTQVTHHTSIPGPVAKVIFDNVKRLHATYVASNKEGRQSHGSTGTLSPFCAIRTQSSSKCWWLIAGCHPHQQSILYIFSGP